MVSGGRVDDDVADELDAVRASLVRAEDDLAVLARRKLKLDDENAALHDELGQHERRAVEAERAAVGSRTTVASLHEQLAAVNQRLTSAQADVLAMHASRERATAVDAERARHSHELAAGKERVRAVTSERDELVLQLKRVQREKTQLADSLRRLECERVEWNASLDALYADKTALDAALAAMTSENIELHTAMNTLRTNVIQLEQRQTRHLLDVSASRQDSLNTSAHEQKARRERHDSRETALRAENDALRAEVERERCARTEYIARSRTTDNHVR